MMTHEQRRNTLAWLRKKRKEAREMAQFLTKNEATPESRFASHWHAGRANAYFAIQRYLAREKANE